MPGIPLRVTKIEQSLGIHSEPFLGRKNNLQFRSVEQANSRKFPFEAFADFRGSDQGFGSGSAWIRINLSCWIRIPIRIPIADPDLGGQK
jgi:hypothetical protein